MQWTTNYHFDDEILQLRRLMRLLKRGGYSPAPSSHCFEVNMIAPRYTNDETVLTFVDLSKGLLVKELLWNLPRPLLNLGDRCL